MSRTIRINKEYLSLPSTEDGLIKMTIKYNKLLFPSKIWDEDDTYEWEKKKVDEWGFTYQIHRLAGYINHYREKKGLKPRPYKWWLYTEDEYNPKRDFFQTWFIDPYDTKKRYGGYLLDE